MWKYLEYKGDYDGTSLGILYQAALNHKKGRDTLIQFLKSHLSVSSVPAWYANISKWFWYRIYSTNIDDLVENIYHKYSGGTGIMSVVAPCEYHDRDAFLRSIQFIKLHGSLNDPVHGLTFGPLEYGRRAAEQDVWYDHFVRDFTTYPTLFIGTELDEPLFWEYIAIRQRRTKEVAEKRPKSFIVCPQISPAKRMVLTDFNVIPIEATGRDFFEELTSSSASIPHREDVLRNIDPSLEELFEFQRSGIQFPQIKNAENFFSVFRPVKSRVVERTVRSHFLLGSPPRWDDIFAGFDAHRDINTEAVELIRRVLSSDSKNTPVVLLNGAAGSGKSTIAKRVSATLVAEGFSVFFADGECRPLPEYIIEYLRFLDRRVVLVFDGATADLRLICEVIARCDELTSMPAVLLVARTNEIAVKRYQLQGVRNLQELKVPDLSMSDIKAILQTLETHGLLGWLRHLDVEERVRVFQTKAKKQILIAMREATRGKGFDEIIEEEFNEIQPYRAKLLYLISAIPSMYNYAVSRGQLIASMDTSPNETSSLIDENLSGILIPTAEDPLKFQIRHPLIAEHVISNAAPRDILAEAYIRYLELLAHDLPPSKERRASRTFKLYRDVINHRSLHLIFLRQQDICRRIYESVRQHFVGDGQYWLQYGSYELEFGDLDFAENYLLQAEALMPDHPWVGTAMGYLLMKKGVEAKSLMEANDLVRQGLARLRQQIVRIGSNDPYPYHVLGSQMLAFTNAWIVKEQKAGKLRELHAEVLEGCKRHPLDTQLKVLADDIKMAELQTVIH